MKVAIEAAVYVLLLCLVLLGCRSAPPDFEPIIKPGGDGQDTCFCQSQIDSVTFVNIPVKSLPKPQFSDTLSGQVYATKISLLADSLPTETKFELSIDQGKNWTESNCFIVKDTMEVWGRLKCKDIVSPVSKVRVHTFYERVFVVGNSITGHGVAPELGWYGDWGMAASAKEMDYLSLLTKRLKLLNPKVEIRVSYDIGFERSYNNYDFTKLDDIAAWKPDLLIMRIGENTNMSYLNQFQDKYDQYILKVISQSETKVVCSTTFWRSTMEATYRIRNIAGLRVYKVAELEPLMNDTLYTARGLFKNQAVADHPGDKGMRAIADIIIGQL
ncbi:hypothetical protein CLV98_112105 [Dyadobacter jejuensis]|uniref:Lysophospholipase L1-like esterase n=1 Tax=Dyadobacter jejuensis TaxID=1082580 RepID=A0A316AGC5_9BACT|nr:SGNH/GDSL hydrolase family protein [Dyadobacter jejuensis]PWJ56010.1 hypothetical protein CLV98_112105 [Dyadobacter jejuensis]